MLKNYLMIAYRSLLKNKVFSLLNTFGLALGMAAFLFIIHYVRYERSYENFHVNADNIWRVTLDLYNGNEYVVTDCETHAPLGPLLKEKMPEVKDYVRMFHNDGQQEIEANNRKFLDEGLYFADPSAFRIFPLKMLNGDTATALSHPYKIVLSEKMAGKYFGRTDVLGESVKIYNELYEVTGVMADLPPNTHLKFDALLSHSTLLKIYGDWYREDGWGGNNEYTYLLMVPGTDLAQFNEKLTALSASLKELKDDRYTAEPMKDIHLYSNKSFEPEPNGSASTVNFLFIIAFFILFIAWVNYVNLSTARAVERAREVGVRKVMGSGRGQLVVQFLAESVLISAMAGVLALVFFQLGFPLFRELTGQPLPAGFLTDPAFWQLFGGVVLAGAVMAGLYPAFVLSSFQPSAVLKGKFRSSFHGQQLRKALVVFQFGATVVLMVGLCAVYLQIQYLRNMDLGMDLDQVLVLRAPRLAKQDSLKEAQYDGFKNELLRKAAVQRVAMSETLPGLSLHELSTTNNVKRLGHEKEGGSYNYYYVMIDEEYLPTLDFELVAGRNFEKGSPNYDRVIINEEAVTRLGFSSAEEAIGSRLTFHTRWQGEPATVIGVLKNFYLQAPKEQQIPMLFRYGRNASYFSLKLHAGAMRETVSSVENVWDRVFPGEVFDYFFLDEKYDQQYQADVRFGSIIATFSALAVCIACLGLFGLSSYVIVQRTKEIAIRKVLGASVGQIVHLVSQDFARVIMIAALVAMPVAYFALDEWLSNYEVRIGLGPWVFILPIFIILLLAFVTISFQTFKAALTNPANSLKQE